MVPKSRDNKYLGLAFQISAQNDENQTGHHVKLNYTRNLWSSNT